MRAPHKHLIVASIALVFAVGCHRDGPKELNSQAFLNGQSAGDGSVTTALQGPAKKENPTAEVTELKATDAAPAPTTRPSFTPAVSVAPATKPSPLQPGQYETVGGVIAEVNGTPIYANKVLAMLDKILAAKAKEVDPSRFRSVAQDLVGKQRAELIQDELEYAAAERFLSKEDKELANQLTMRWRGQQIVENGGSPEVTKRRAADIARKNDFPDDLDFDGVVAYQHRRYMRELFLERRIRPKLQVSADDMRRFYEKNKDQLFTTHSAAQFRVIKIDPKKYDSREVAIAKAKEIHDEVASGDKDFATVAGEQNDDDYLKEHGGDATGGKWMDRGAYRISEVEDAVWKLQPGQVSDIIAAGGAFYVAKLEATKAGNSRPFTDPGVQDDIRARLSAQQYASLRDKVRQDLTADALIRPETALVRFDDELMDAAMEMVMQKYSRGATEKKEQAAR